MAETEDDQPVELNISSEKIRDIVLLTREFDLTDFPRDPDFAPEPDDDPAGEEMPDDDPTETELREIIDDLNEDEVVDLVALAWVGRGDFGRAEWPEARAQARERRNERSSDYLMGMPTLSEFLDEGLVALGHPGVDADED